MSAVERAFAIARSGTCLSVQDIKLQMRQEGFPVAETEPHLAGPSIRKQLVALMAEARRG
jgi:hypothetical protein